MVETTITVTRGDEDIDIELCGEIEYFGSANPYERGHGLGNWCVKNPVGFVLTPKERDLAEDALVRSME